MQNKYKIYLLPTSHSTVERKIFTLSLAYFAGSGGGKGYSRKLYTDRLRPRGTTPYPVYTTVFTEKGNPFLHLLLTNFTPFKYQGLELCLHPIQLL